ncbi:hypothetical protein ABZ756_13770 [Mammaliicoccus sciuri]|uniref:Uncharacterized protein n=1 Tax=Sporosarcina newyorkensis TaxID=759851 RepID=A0A1T4YTC3_9BACL|nr:hypothetical protein [Sporosarcina newyorkensis]SKB05117.1 hypothetical protein SAMN04244570_3561 [Sporosarcina newyorkensis]
MDFRSFLRPYMITVYLNERADGSDGEYVDGVWVPGTDTKTPFRAVITNFTDDILQFGEGGTYSTDDEKLYTYKKLERGQSVTVRKLDYTVMEERDYSFYGKGLRMYVIRRDGIASN